jgi:hypothetical protein
MRWVVLVLGVLSLAFAAWNHYRAAALQDQWEQEGQAALKLAAQREKEASEHPGRAMIIYERPEDPALSAVSNGEFYLALPPVLWDIFAGVTLMLGIILAYRRRQRNPNTAAD